MPQLRTIALTYLRYPAWPLLVYGFSAGMPFKALFAVVALYLNELGIDLTTITLLTLLGLFYSLKFLWSPILDSPPASALARKVGKRRIALLTLQSAAALLFLAIATIDPLSQWWLFVGALALAALFSATADIAIDALRIELAGQQQQGILSANYLIGYRIGLIAGIAVPLYCAESASWFWAFASVAAMLAPSLLTTAIIKEPQHSEAPGSRTGAWLTQLLRRLVSALKDFMQRYQSLFVGIVAVILFYRFCDLLLGAVAYPFYADAGYSKTQIGFYSGVLGVIITLLGGMLGGYLLTRMRWRSLLLIGLGLAAISNLAFIVLAFFGHGDLPALLAATIVADNLAGGMATTIFIAWISSLVNLHFTAVQYALLSSLSTLSGKLAGAGSGWFIDTADNMLGQAAAATDSQMTAYALFFAVTALAALPALVAIMRLPDRAIEPTRR